MKKTIILFTLTLSMYSYAERNPDAPRGCDRARGKVKVCKKVTRETEESVAKGKKIAAELESSKAELENKKDEVAKEEARISSLRSDLDKATSALNEFNLQNQSEIQKARSLRARAIACSQKAESNFFAKTLLENLLENSSTLNSEVFSLLDSQLKDLSQGLACIDNMKKPLDCSSFENLYSILSDEELTGGAKAPIFNAFLAYVKDEDVSVKLEELDKIQDTLNERCHKLNTTAQDTEEALALKTKKLQADVDYYSNRVRESGNTLEKLNIELRNAKIHLGAASIQYAIYNPLGRVMETVEVCEYVESSCGT